jgi:hypothetical protein
MIDGKAADSHYFTLFYAPGFRRNLESLEKLTQVEGMKYCSSKLEKGLSHGHGKILLTGGRVFIGQFK